MILSSEEQRVLGCLIEKQMTTPDYYPMTVNALAAACNQKSNRSPVVDYSESDVVLAVDELRDKGLARTVHGKGDRTLKYRHVADDLLHLSPAQAALLAVLLLRGAQTPGELRSRTGRYVDFAALRDVTTELTALANAEDPLVELLERRPGEKEARYRHLLGAPPDAEGWEPSPVATPNPDRDRVAELERQLADLHERVARMERDLGLSGDDGIDSERT